MQRKQRPLNKTRRQCHTGKIRYRTEEEAYKAIKLASRDEEREARERKPIRAYPCDDCHGWHLTSREYHGHWLARATGVYPCCGAGTGNKHELSCESVSPEEFFARTGGRVREGTR